MTKPVWKTPKNLGVVEDGAYFEKQLEASSVETLSFHIISGDVPAGIEINDSGTLSGVPTVMNSQVGELNQQVSFTVRTVNNLGQLADRTFTLMVSGVQPPTIETVSKNLGFYFDGEYFKYQLLGTDNHPGSNLTWRHVRGRLPPGITLNTKGVLEGFFYQNKVDPVDFQRIGWDKISWDRFLFDFVREQDDVDYEFTVELSDGINYSRQNYIIRVLAKYLLTDEEARRHLPFITTMPQRLPEIKLELARQDTYFAFQFQAIDFDGDEIYFEITSPDELGFDQNGYLDIELVESEPGGPLIKNFISLSGTGFDMDAFDSSEFPMPLYVGLNNDTGWYTGHIDTQTEHQIDYIFQIYARKKTDIHLKGYRSTFQLSVLGQVTESVNWITDSDLGSIENGSISGLRVQAEHSNGRDLIYYLKGDTLCRTPQGIILLKNGMLSGRASFNHFTIDQGMRFDQGETTFETVYRFTVVAETANRSAYSERTFTLQVKQVNSKPFENLYLKGFPNSDQRRLFKSIMDDPVLFPNELIYRLDDPWYGKSSDLRFLFLPGINPSDLPVYVEALSRNHYTKTVLFGDVKTAVALDHDFNILYEVVYLDVIDEGEGRDPITGEPRAPKQTIDLSHNKNYFSDGTIEFTELTPNGLGNMRVRIEDYIGLANANTLPLWMSSPQPDPENPGLYTIPLGFVRAVVLAYTLPGASKLVAYRLKNTDFNFNYIPFTTDRYQLDNYLTNNYDLELGKFFPSEECTFDISVSEAEKFRDKGEVDFAVNSLYDEINGRTVGYIIDNKSLDGAEEFTGGQTVIFARQDGIFPDQVPGYIEQILYAATNERAAVYQINIEDGVVFLEKVRDTLPGDVVKITSGTVYKNLRLYFEAYTKHGTVPRWWPLTVPLVSDIASGETVIVQHNETTFDRRGTRFFTNRDQYAGPETDAKYIVFPKIGAFI